MADLSNLVSVLQRKIMERDAKIKNLEEQVQASGKPGAKQWGAEGITDLQQRILTLETENAQLKEDLAAARGTGAGAAVMPITTLVQELQKKIKKKDEEIARLKADRNEPEGPRSGTGDHAPCQQRVAELSAEIQQLQAALGAEKAKAGSESESISGQNSKLQAIIEGLQANLRQKEQLLQAQQEEIRALKGQGTVARPAIATPVVAEQILVGGEAPKAAGVDVKEGRAEIPAEEVAIIDTARWMCPRCGNNNRGMIREETDKSVLLNAYPPVYGKKLICGNCGKEWHPR